MDRIFYKSPYDITLPLPVVQATGGENEYGTFTIEPLDRGWAITLGNSLRRVLLGSLTGAAITSVKIDSVYHEFATIPGMREQVLDFLLNVKGIRIRPLAKRPGRLRLEVSGEGHVTAADIRSTTDFEIVNPEHYLGSLTSRDAHLAAEFEVNLGVGYKPAVDQAESETRGTMPLDAVFTPIKSVAYRSESARTSGNPYSERLVIEINTDGTVTASEALKQASRILHENFSRLARFDETSPDDALLPNLSPEVANMLIEDLKLQPRTMNALTRNKITKVSEILIRSDKELMALHNFGKKAYDEVKMVLRERGLIPPLADEGNAADNTKDVMPDAVPASADAKDTEDTEDTNET